MTKQTTIVLGMLFAVTIMCVTAIIIFNKDPAPLMTLLAANLVPAILTIWAGNRADKAAQQSTVAAVAAEQAVENTNGRMSELIADRITRGEPVDMVKYADVVQRLDIDVPPEQAIYTTERKDV